MDEERVWTAVDERRVALIALLDDLSDDEWRKPSLCAGWTVQDVVAHLTYQNASVLSVLKELPYLRGGLQRMTRDAAVRRAATWPRAELVGVGALRRMVGERCHPPFVTYREALIDWLVHPQDIALPLGRSVPMPPDAAASAADHIWSTSYPFFARRRLRGLRLVATDVDWTAGAGDRELRAPMGDLLLTLSGRARPA